MFYHFLSHKLKRNLEACLRLAFVHITRRKVSFHQEMGQGWERPCPEVSISLKGNLSQVPRDQTAGQVTVESIIPQIYGNTNG